MFDRPLRISTRKTNAEPRCLTSLVSHDRVICAAKHLELVHAHHLANPYTDLTQLHMMAWKAIFTIGDQVVLLSKFS